jgi:hypothetical protein
MTDPSDLGAANQETADEGYAVGYKKPPKKSQFGKGNMAGKGRSKGAKSLKTMVIAALGVKVAAQIGGKEVKLSKVELAVHQLANKASKGDLKAISGVLDLQARYGPQDYMTTPLPAEAKADMAALKAYFALQLGIVDEGTNDE